jgi:hypothetical protein
MLGSCSSLPPASASAEWLVPLSKGVSCSSTQTATACGSAPAAKQLERPQHTAAEARHALTAAHGMPPTLLPCPCRIMLRTWGWIRLATRLSTAPLPPAVSSGRGCWWCCMLCCIMCQCNADSDDAAATHSGRRAAAPAAAARLAVPSSPQRAVGRLAAAGCLNRRVQATPHPLGWHSC